MINRKFLLLLSSIIIFANINVYAEENTFRDNPGAYYQLGRYNGRPIIWRSVVSEDDPNGILMVSNDILCEKSFDVGNEFEIPASSWYEMFGSDDWSISCIRDWLNSTSDSGQVKWTKYAPTEQRVHGVPSQMSHPGEAYDQEKGFLHSDNFSESERSVIKSVMQWQDVVNEEQQSENGNTEKFISIYQYERGRDGIYTEGQITIDDCSDAYSKAAMYRLSDTIFLLDMQQLHNMYIAFGAVAASNEAEYEWGTWTRNSGYSWRVLTFKQDVNPNSVLFENIAFGIGAPANEKRSVRPAFYLNEDTAVILSGSGTIEDPYILGGIQQNGITVFGNGKQVDFDVEPIIENDRTLVEMRKVFESLGADVEWNEENQTVTAVKDDIIVQLRIGSNIMQVNNSIIDIDTPAKIINDNTIVPIRAVSEALGAKVDWIEELKRVVIDQDPMPIPVSDWNPIWYQNAINNRW